MSQTFSRSAPALGEEALGIIACRRRRLRARRTFCLVSLILVSLTLYVPPAFGAAQPRLEARDNSPLILFFIPGIGLDNGWIQRIIAYSRVAASDLGMHLEIVFTLPHREGILQGVKDRIEYGDTPDFALIMNTRGLGAEVLKYLNNKSVKTFLFASGLSAKSLEALGHPRERLPYWIGELLPDDEEAGYNLARFLIEEAERRFPGRKHRVLAFRGVSEVQASVLRVKGLRRALRESPNAELLQVSAGHWIPQVVAFKYPLLRKRYGRIDIIWAASDDMAMGALGALSPTEDNVLVGGMDATPSALTAIRAGRLTASMGGHFIDVAYALAFLRSYADGDDFVASDGGVKRSSLVRVDANNVDFFSDALSPQSHLFYSFSRDAMLYGKTRRSEGISIYSFLKDVTD